MCEVMNHVKNNDLAFVRQFILNSFRDRGYMKQLCLMPTTQDFLDKVKKNSHHNP